MTQYLTKIPQELQNSVYDKFTRLSLQECLVVYARLVHGNSFKAQNNDMFGLNRRLTSKIYRDFLESIKQPFNEGSLNESEETLDNCG